MGTLQWKNLNHICLLVLGIVLLVKYLIQQSFTDSIKKDLQNSVAEVLSKTKPSATPSPTPSPTPTLSARPWLTASPSPTSTLQSIIIPPPPPVTGVNHPVNIVGNCDLPSCVRAPKHSVGMSTTVTILEDGGAQNRDTVFSQMSKCYVPYGSTLIFEREWDDNYFRAQVRTMESTYGLMCPNRISVAVEKNCGGNTPRNF